MSLDALPIFATDAELAVALLGKGRAKAWADLVPLYERKGLPKIDPLTGGRYVPAVRRFFDEQNGVSSAPPLRAPDGIEEPGKFSERKQRARR